MHVVQSLLFCYYVAATGPLAKQQIMIILVVKAIVQVSCRRRYPEAAGVLSPYAVQALLLQSHLSFAAEIQCVNISSLQTRLNGIFQAHARITCVFTLRLVALDL
jgi:hypothetical protein